ncbi:MAG: FIST C-terminal domain-containing protein [Planctomycetota bacterium]|jgi:hypothetical protein|nr:FIST C-terminal domain-containing protein [Planctomycetota bacterium]
MDYRSVGGVFTSSDPGENAREAVGRLRAGLADFPVGALLFFAPPSSCDSRLLAAGIRDAFPEAKTFGCSGAGVIHDGMLLDNAFTAMAFSAGVFETLEIAAVGGIDSNPLALDQALGDLRTRLGRDLLDLDYREYLGFVLIDGLSSSMEPIMNRIGDLTNILFTGGCAGDELKFEKTLVYANGQVYENGMVIAVMRPRGKWGVIKSQSVVPGDQTLTATRVEEDRNVIWEFDGKPAAQAFADAIGVAAEDLTPEKFSECPLALMADGQPFIRSIATPVGDGGLRLYLRPARGLRYVIARTKDLAPETRADVEAKRREIGGISAIVNISCILRKLQMIRDGSVEAHSEVFAGFPSAGFFSFGEIFIGLVNQTATMVAFA